MELPKGWSSNYTGPKPSGEFVTIPYLSRYSHATEAGQLEITGPALSAMSAAELREWIAFLHLIVRQAERIAGQKEQPTQ